MASLWCVSHWADPDAQYDSRMNPNEGSAFRSNSVVEMTVFATVSESQWSRPITRATFVNAAMP